MNSTNNEKKKKSRNFKHGAVATAITVGVIIVAILLNVLMVTLDKNFGLQFDMTKNNFYGLSQETKDYISTLSKDVEILVLNDKDSFMATDSKYYVQASKIIDQYPQNSNKITVDYVSLSDNPNISNKYSQDNIKENDVIVKTGDNYKHLTSTDLFEQSMNYQTYSYSIVSSKAEQAITSAILNVTSDKKVKVEFLTGYNEDSSDNLKKILENNNYEVSETKILTSNIGDDTSTVVIFGPTLDYDAQSIDKLNTYMEKTGTENKNLFYIASPDAPDTPNLNAFLSKWGITVGSGNVFETNYNNLFYSSPYYFVAQYVDEEYADMLNSTDIPVAMPASKPIQTTSVDSVQSTILLESSSDSGICPADADENWTITEDTISGPITVACIGSKTSNNSVSNVCAIGTTQAFDVSLTSMSALNNSSYFTNVFNTLSNKNDGIVIESKSVQYDTLGISATQSLIFAVVFVLIIPIAFLVIGIVVWVRRRHS